MPSSYSENTAHTDSIIRKGMLPIETAYHARRLAPARLSIRYNFGRRCFFFSTFKVNAMRSTTAPTIPLARFASITGTVLFRIVV